MLNPSRDKTKYQNNQTFNVYSIAYQDERMQLDIESIKIKDGVKMLESFDEFETEIEIDGAFYKVNMSFNNVYKFFNILKNPTLNDAEKVYYAVYRMIDAELDLEIEELAEVLERIIREFINDGEEIEQKVDLEGNIMPTIQKEPTYDLNHDGMYIYSSFLQAYHIDLFDVKDSLDWRKFKGLLLGLPEGTKFREVMEIRTRPYPKGKGLSEERKNLKELKRHYALPKQNTKTNGE